MSEAPTYPTCSTCKHWERHPDTYEAHAACRVIDSEAGEDTSPVQVWSQGGYANLQTLPSFGCGLHSDLTEAGA